MTSHIPTSFQDGFRTEFRPSLLGLIIFVSFYGMYMITKARLDIDTFKSANTKRKLLWLMYFLKIKFY